MLFYLRERLEYCGVKWKREKREKCCKNYLSTSDKRRIMEEKRGVYVRYFYHITSTTEDNCGVCEISGFQDARTGLVEAN